MFSRSKSRKTDSAVLDRPEAAPPDAAGDPDAQSGILPAIETALESLPLPKKAEKVDDKDLEYEWEMHTPFGKVEFEFEPKKKHEERELKRKAKADAEAARKAQKVAKAAAKEAEKRGIEGPVVIVKRSNLVPVLVVFALVVTAIAVAYWLFGRPEDDLDEVPDNLRKEGFAAAQPGESKGIGARIKNAVRAGRKASREAQDEQQKRFEEMTHQG